MVGDFILWVRDTLKKHFCIHDYGDDCEVIHCGMQLFRIYECKKCGWTKTEEI